MPDEVTRLEDSLLQLDRSAVEASLSQIYLAGRLCEDLLESLVPESELRRRRLGSRVWTKPWNLDLCR